MGGFCSNQGCGVSTECPRCDPPIEWSEEFEAAGHRIKALEAERDALAAQVAFMLDNMAEAITLEAGETVDALRSSLASALPAAAARYLAADRVAQGIMAQRIDTDAMDEYRRACGEVGK